MTRVTYIDSQNFPRDNTRAFFSLPTPPYASPRSRENAVYARWNVTTIRVLNHRYQSTFQGLMLFPRFHNADK